MRILWFSNIKLTNAVLNHSGTWIYSMYSQLASHPDVSVVGNITLGHNESVISKDNFCEITLSNKCILKNGKLKAEVALSLKEKVKNLRPDLIHIWGIELPWKIIADQVAPNIPHLTEIQGLKTVISNPAFFNAGLDRLPRNILGPFEFLVPAYSLKYNRNAFAKAEPIERQILGCSRFINTQSQWVRDNLESFYGIKSQIYKTGIILRDSFTSCTPWLKVRKSCKDHPVIFTLGASSPLKGTHVVIEALSLLRKEFPNIELRIGGIRFEKHHLLTSGYLRYLNSLIKSKGLSKNVVFIGNLVEKQIVEELYNCDVSVTPSFVESYCVALAEALSVGAPCVASYSGALPELIIHGHNGLLFTPGDYVGCANNIKRILTDAELATSMSENASRTMRKKCDKQALCENQVNIYKDILSKI